MQFDREKFAEVLGTSFVLKAGDGQTVDVELIEVTPANERPHQISYSMIFRLPENYSVEQGLYDLEHETLDDLQLFLVPLGPNPTGMRLEAVINLLRETES